MESLTWQLERELCSSKLRLTKVLGLLRCFEKGFRGGLFVESKVYKVLREFSKNFFFFYRKSIFHFDKIKKEKKMK